MQKVIIQRVEADDWLVVWPSGRVESKRSPEAVLREINRRDARASKRTGATVMTMIDWRDVPPGWTPPDLTK